MLQYKEYYKNNTKHIKEQKKQYRKEIKEANIQNISNMLEQINVTFKRLNLPIYGTIYKFENINTGRTYIGQTILSLNERYGSDIVNNWIKERLDKSNQKFKEELIKQDIRVDIIDVAFCKYHLDKLEAYYINKYNSFNNGYNNNAGCHDSDDGIEEFNELLQKYNLQFIDGKLIECA